MNTSNIVIPIAFAETVIQISPGVLLQGLEWFYFTPSDVVQYAESVCVQGNETNLVFELASLSRKSSVLTVSELMRTFDVQPISDVDVWIYLIPRWIYENRTETNAYAMYDWFCTDFDYPTPYTGLLNYEGEANEAFWRELHELFLSS